MVKRAKEGGVDPLRSAMQQQQASIGSSSSQQDDYNDNVITGIEVE